MNNFCFLIYTNENYLPIVDLTLGEFDIHFPENELKRYVVSNNFSNYNFSNEKSVFLNCHVPFDGMGHHFAQTMRTALNLIKEEYIIFFCDDYMLIDKPNTFRLEKLMGEISKRKIDFFSFASMLPKKNWGKIKFDSFPDQFFYTIPENYQYLYSVQPCIWKKSSLLEILKYNSNISLHGLDTSNIKNKEGFSREMNYETALWKPYPKGSQNYGFQNICTEFKGYDELEKYNFFIFPYIEIIRHGKFNMFHNTNTKRFLEKFIIEKNIINNPNFKSFL